MSPVQQIQSTHSCLCFMLILAQCFGMLPITGITGNDYRSLQFRWTSKRTISSLIFILISIFNEICFIIKTTKSELKIQRFVSIEFFGSSLLTIILFLDLGRKWPFVMEKWSEVDFAMRSYGFPSKLHLKLKRIAFIVMLSAAVEHCFFLTFTLKNMEKGKTLGENIDKYLKNNFIYVFDIIPYHTIFGVFMQIFNIFTTCVWNFMDLFIMLISTTLSARFTQVVRRLKRLSKAQVKDVRYWETIREDYNRLSQLCTIIDNSISDIIILSFANNLFMVLVQLFNSLQTSHKDAIGKIYFIYSFGFLIIRTISVALCASSIYSESKKPADILNGLPHDIYNVEIKRLIIQIKYDSCALTGRHLFSVTKSLILSVAGAIVTYELILIQFNSY